MFALPYLFLFIIFYISSLWQNKKSVFGQWLVYSALFCFVIFIGLRGFVSTDWLHYYPYYNGISTNGSFDYRYFAKTGWEIGVPYLMYIIKRCGFDYFGYCFISTFFDFIILYNFFKSYLNKYLLLGFLFFLLFGGLNIEFNLLRCSKAIDMFLISLKFINKKRHFVLFFIINYIGYLFHTAALFYVLFYILYHIKIFENKKVVIILWIVGLLIYILKFGFLFRILNLISIFLPARIRWLVKHYAALATITGTYSFGFGFIERFLSFGLLLYYSDLFIDNTKLKPFYIMSIIYFYIYLYCYEVYIIVERLGIQVIAFYWILFPIIYQNLSKKKKCYFLLILLFYSLLKIYATYGNNFQFLYENILINKPNYYYRVQNFL